MRKGFVAPAFAVGAIFVAMSMAHACGLDGVPSLQINGRLVVVNRALPVRGQLSMWAPFVAPDVYPAGQPVLLQEIRGRVLWTLPPSAFKTPWRWTFGDNTSAQGLSTHHIYRQRGTFVVGVQAYLSDVKDSQWYLFDAVVIHIR